MVEKFFICPHCENGLYTKEQMNIYRTKGIEISYCRKCGEDIKGIYEKALNSFKSEELSERSICIKCKEIKKNNDDYCWRCGERHDTEE